jgi:hypothetical protein
MTAPDENDKDDINVQYYLVADDGSFRFTKEGLENYRSRFAKVGIDIHTIKTKTDYLLVIDKSAPYFFEWLEELYLRKFHSAPPKDLRTRLRRDFMVALIRGEDAQAQKILDKVNLIAKWNNADG